MKRRLRVFDWATRWFWLVIFWGGTKPGIYLYPAPKWVSGWFNVWQWEDEPERGGAFAQHKGK
jgi:hypothetical protein